MARLSSHSGQARGASLGTGLALLGVMVLLGLGCLIHHQSLQLRAVRRELEELRASTATVTTNSSSSSIGGDDDASSAAASARTRLLSKLLAVQQQRQQHLAGTEDEAAVSPQAAWPAVAAATVNASRGVSLRVPVVAAAGAETGGVPEAAIDVQQQQQPAAPPPGTINIDLVRLLGLRGYLGGITWEPKQCFSSMKEVFPGASADDLAHTRARLVAELVAAAAAARGVEPGDIDVTQPWWGGVRGRAPMPERAILSDPEFGRWQVAVVRVLSRWLVTLVGRRPAVPCPAHEAVAAAASNASNASNATAGKELGLGDLPLPACPSLGDGALLSLMGRHPQPWDALDTIADVLVDPGLCTVPLRDGHSHAGDWLLSRALDPTWRTFHTASPEQDAVLFLADVVMQQQELYLKQRWLNVAVMQHPFDLLAIGDLISAARPHVVLETGTANGGSALAWASFLELEGLADSAVVTVDFTPPGTPAAFGADLEAELSDAEEEAKGRGVGAPPPRRRRQAAATEHRLWRKYVRFVGGGSTDAAVVARVRALVAERAAALGLAPPWEEDEEEEDEEEAGAAAADASDDAAARGVARALLEAVAEEPQLLLMHAHQASQEEAGGGFARLLPQTATAAPVAAAPAAGAAGAGAAAADAVAAAPHRERTPRRQGRRERLRVLVLLDSEHTASHVLAELRAYAELVTPGSWLVVQDTKLSRFSDDANGGPLQAVGAFLGEQRGRFVVDRSRELLLTNHPQGYLYRVPQRRRR